MDDKALNQGVSQKTKAKFDFGKSALNIFCKGQLFKAVFLYFFMSANFRTSKTKTTFDSDKIYVKTFRNLLTDDCTTGPSRGILGKDDHLSYQVVNLYCIKTSHLDLIISTGISPLNGRYMG